MTLQQRIRHDEAARAAANRRDRLDVLVLVVPLFVIAIAGACASVVAWIR